MRGEDDETVVSRAAFDRSRYTSNALSELQLGKVAKDGAKWLVGSKFDHPKFVLRQPRFS